MPFPANRRPIRPARGTFAALTAELAEIRDGEIVQPTDRDALYVKRGGALVPMGGEGTLNPADFATAAQGEKADAAVLSVTTGLAGATLITKIVAMSQEDYDARAILPDDSTTLFVVP